ncbi:MAG: class I SAM-dependent methyltransferase [Nitrospiraceae bacterium]
MGIAREIAQNLLMGIAPLARAAQRLHSTGLNGDLREARRVYDFYRSFASVEGRDILEIGPGHTLEVLHLAKTAGARSCTALDVVAYCSMEEASRSGLDYVLYEGREIPLPSARYDLIWSHNAFEHLRYPALVLRECARVLRPGGLLIAQIDLADHGVYPSGDRSRLFDCLRYPDWLWNLMKWNRSSYVNRLRSSDWRAILSEAGFAIREWRGVESPDIEQVLSELSYLHRYSREDALTAVLIVCAEKPITP